MERTGRQLLSLIAAALLGGYALATASSIFLAGVLPLARHEAVLASTQLSFAIYTGAVIWVFSVRRPLYAWMGLMTPTVVLSGIGLLLAGQSA